MPTEAGGPWLHATTVGFVPGDVVTPPAERDASPASWGPSLGRAIAMGQYRSDRVYCFDSQGLHVRNFIGGYQFTSGEDVHVYEVEPIGARELDPDRTALATFGCFERALVIREVWPAPMG